MDKLFPHEPVHDASTPPAQVSSTDQATAVNLADKAEFPETAAKPTSAQAIQNEAAAIPEQSIPPAYRNQAAVFQSIEPRQIPSGTPSPPLSRPVPQDANQTAPDISTARRAVEPSNAIRDIEPVDDINEAEKMPPSPERLEQLKPMFDGRPTEQPVPSLPVSQSRTDVPPNVDPAITQAGETKKSAERPEQPIGNSPDVPTAPVSSNSSQIADEYPDISEDKLDQIAAKIIAARPKSVQAQQVFANTPSIRGLLKRRCTVKEIYDHLVDEKCVFADDLSFKQFERQVDNQKLRDKPAKSSPSVRSPNTS